MKSFSWHVFLEVSRLHRHWHLLGTGHLRCSLQWSLLGPGVRGDSWALCVDGECGEEPPPAGRHLLSAASQTRVVSSVCIDLSLLQASPPGPSSSVSVLVLPGSPCLRQQHLLCPAEGCERTVFQISSESSCFCHSSWRCHVDADIWDRSRGIFVTWGCG